MEKMVTFVPTLPIMVQVPKAAVKCGTPKSNLDFQVTNYLIIDFSSMHRNEVYAFENVVNAEIRLRESHLNTKVKARHEYLRKLKSEIQDIEQKKLESDGNYQRISETVTLAYSSLEDEGITPEMAPDAKIAQLAELVMDLKKKLVQLEEKRIPNTPPECSYKGETNLHRLRNK